MIRIIDKFCAAKNIQIQIILDNAHAINSDELVKITTNTSWLKFIIMGQPKEDFNSLHSKLGLTIESLSGWHETSILAEATELKIQRISPININRLLNITSGLPLFINSLLQVCIKNYNYNLDNLCSDLESLTHLEDTVQEILLRKVFDSVGIHSQKILSILSYAYSLTIDEIENIDPSINQQIISRAIRELKSYEIISSMGQNIKIHDAIRMVAKNHLISFPDSDVYNIKNNLKSVLFQSFIKSHDFRNLLLFLKILIEIKNLDELIDVASQEFFNDCGLPNEIWHFLSKIAVDTSIENEVRVNVCFALIFNSIQNNSDYITAKYYIDIVEILLPTLKNTQKHLLEYSIKNIRIFAYFQQKDKFLYYVRQAQRQLPNDFSFIKIYKYEVACGHYLLKNYFATIKILMKLINLYNNHFDININKIRTNELIADLVMKKSNSEDCKHLADTLVLLENSFQNLGYKPTINWKLKAAALYKHAYYHTSYTNTLRELAEDFLKFHDTKKAIEVMENFLLPYLDQHNLIDQILCIKCQYGAILAIDKQYDKGKKIIEEILPYYNNLQGSEKDEIVGNINLFNTLSPNKILVTNL